MKLELELEIDVPESRTVTLTLPPDTPVGKATVSVRTRADPSPPPPGISEKARRERAAFFRLLPELLKTHYGKVVAIHDERVIAVGDERRPVIDAARKIAGYVDMYIERVQESRPVERLPSIREMGGPVS